MRYDNYFMAIGKIFSYNLNFGLFVKESHHNILQQFIIQTILLCNFIIQTILLCNILFLDYIEYFNERNVDVSELLPVVHQSLEILEKRVLVLIKKALN